MSCCVVESGCHTMFGYNVWIQCLDIKAFINFMKSAGLIIITMLLTYRVTISSEVGSCSELGGGTITYRDINSMTKIILEWQPKLRGTAPCFYTNDQGYCAHFENCTAYKRMLQMIISSGQWCDLKNIFKQKAECSDSQVTSLVKVTQWITSLAFTNILIQLQHGK